MQPARVRRVRRRAPAGRSAVAGAGRRRRRARVPRRRPARTRRWTRSGSAIMGGSYGGYLHRPAHRPDRRFAGAVVERAFTDPVSFVGSSDIGWYFPDAYLGTDPERVAAQSALAAAPPSPPRRWSSTPRRTGAPGRAGRPALRGAAAARRPLRAAALPGGGARAEPVRPAEAPAGPFRGTSSAGGRAGCRRRQRAAARARGRRPGRAARQRTGTCATYRPLAVRAAGSTDGPRVPDVLGRRALGRASWRGGSPCWSGSTARSGDPGAPRRAAGAGAPRPAPRAVGPARRTTTRRPGPRS